MSRRARRAVLILGAGTMQIPAIRIAKRNGWYTCVADGDRNAPGRSLADEFLHVDLKDCKGMTRCALELKSRVLLSGVFTAGTDFSATVSWVAEKLGLPCIPYRVALSATDKARMRKVFKRAHVPCPRYAVIAASDPVRRFPGVPFPLVVKPADNMGARGVMRIDTEDELADAVSAARVHSRSGGIVVEEYLEGPELSIDAIVWKGEIKICGVADRHITFAPYFVEIGHTLPTQLDPSAVDEVVSVFRRGVRALGIDRGAAKGDMKIAKTGPAVLEIAARLSGGYMSGWTYPYATGVEATESALRISLGLEPGDLSENRHHVSAERAVISLPGVVDRVDGVDIAEKLPGVRNVFLRVLPGQPVVFPTNNVEKCGNVITQGETHGDAVQFARSALRSISLRLVPGHEATDAFLFGDRERTARRLDNDIAAFCLERRENLRLLQLAGITSGPRWEDSRSPQWWRSGLASLPADAASIPAPEGLWDETCVDWYGNTPAEAIGQVEELTGARFHRTRAPHLLRPARHFWRAFLLGTVQGAAYVVDTWRMHGRKEKILQSA